MWFDCLKAAFAASSGVKTTSAVVGGGNDPTLLTLMAPSCPKAALTSKQGSHSYCYSNNENGTVKTNSKQKADYKMSECFLLCLHISQNSLEERGQGWSNQEEPIAVVIIYQLHVLLVLSTKEDVSISWQPRVCTREANSYQQNCNFEVGNKSDHAHMHTHRSDLCSPYTSIINFSSISIFLLLETAGHVNKLQKLLRPVSRCPTLTWSHHSPFLTSAPLTSEKQL